MSENLTAISNYQNNNIIEIFHQVHNHSRTFPNKNNCSFITKLNTLTFDFPGYKDREGFLAIMLRQFILIWATSIWVFNVNIEKYEDWEIRVYKKRILETENNDKNVF